MNKLSDIGLIGLAVMGENLVLNMESKGYQVTVYNRSAQKVEDFLAGRHRRHHPAGSRRQEDIDGRIDLDGRLFDRGDAHDLIPAITRGSGDRRHGDRNRRSQLGGIRCQRGRGLERVIGHQRADESVGNAGQIHELAATL